MPARREHPCFALRTGSLPGASFSAALDDAMRAYNYLSRSDTTGRRRFRGESAGADFLFARGKAKEIGNVKPGCKLQSHLGPTLRFRRFTYNKRRKRSVLTRHVCANGGYVFRDCTDPHVFPLFADLSGLAPSKIYVGSDENPPR